VKSLAIAGTCGERGGRDEPVSKMRQLLFVAILLCGCAARNPVRPKPEVTPTSEVPTVSGSTENHCPDGYEYVVEYTITDQGVSPPKYYCAKNW
jgi:hypothetical protein